MDLGAEQHGCEHYTRRCMIRAPCCGEVFGCRHCHNQAKNSLEVDLLDRHEIPRHEISKPPSAPAVGPSARRWPTCAGHTEVAQAPAAQAPSGRSGAPASEALAPDPAPASEALFALSIRAADLHVELVAAGHKISEEDEDEGYVAAASKGGRSTAASRRREDLEGLEEDDGYGDAGPPSPSSSGYAGERGEQRRLQRRRPLRHRGARPLLGSVDPLQGPAHDAASKKLLRHQRMSCSCCC